MRNVAAQRHRMNRVTNYARAHVSDALSLDALADIACLSKFHFSRVFAGHFGESPSQFLARVRLELAARRLVYMRERSITQVAMDCGFSGSDTFARSFRARFGSAPSAFRDSNRWSLESFDKSHPYGTEIHKPGTELPVPDFTDLQVRIEHRPEYHVAYIRHVGPYGDVDDSISRTFDALQRWAELRGVLRHDTSYVGISPDNCSTTPARHCVYDACMLLEGEIAEDDVVSVQTIPAATYAVLRVTCRSAQLNRMWNWLNSSWLPDSGKRLAFRPSYEFFPEFGVCPVRADHGAQLCLPIKN